MTYLFEAITPTRIYHKQCSHCGLNYLGKSVKKDIENYPGSGKHWKRHLKKHNAKSIHIWNSDWFHDTSIVEYALDLSEKLNVIESKEWANKKPENGLDGGDNSEFIDYTNYSELTSKRNLLRSAQGLHPWQLNANNRTPHSEETKQKIRQKQNDLVNQNLHPWQDAIAQRERQKVRVNNGTHNFLGGEIQGKTSRRRVQEGTHNLLGPSVNLQMLENGTHPSFAAKNKVTCYDKEGNFVRIDKEIYWSQTGPKESWEYVHSSSKLGRQRKQNGNA